MPILSILTDAEIRQFNLPPKFSNTERARYFTLSPNIKRMINRMDNNITRTGFILQWGYFKDSGRFFQKKNLESRTSNTYRNYYVVRILM